MKKILTILMLLVSLITYSQITPAIPGNGTITTDTVISGDYVYNGNLKVDAPATLKINAGVNFTLNGNWNSSSGNTIFLGSNIIIINGNINSSVSFTLNGNVCVYTSQNYNASVGYVTYNGTNNYISSGGNFNNINDIPQGICANSNISNPCSNLNSIPCGNQCSQDSNNLVTWNTSWTTNGNAATPSSTKVGVINSNYSGPSFTVCSLTVNSGKTLTITNGVVVTVINSLKNNGIIIIENGGSLVQVNDAANNSGNITVNRQTSPLKVYDYTYWSTPVTGATLASTTNNNLHEFMSFSYNPSVTDPNAGWTDESSTTQMVKGKGYITRTPDNITFPNAGTTQLSVQFTGVPNNGIVTIPVSKNSTVASNLIGNPYPSALNADTFLANATNSTNLTGVVYLWTHNTAIALASTIQNPGSGTYAYTANDYASYNLTGGVGTGTTALSGGVKPSGKIASGQGFFVGLKSTLANGNYNLVINNAMRVNTNSSNSQFYRTANTTTDTIEKNRLWFNLSNTDGAYSESLLGYITGATNDIDYGYDAPKILAGNYIDIYSVITDNKFSIQGRDINFDQNDIIQVGYDSTLSGEFKIAVDSTDGFFDTQDVYLVDKFLNITTNIKNVPYTFITDAGTFLDRFELRFTTTLNTVELEVTNLTLVANDGTIRIQSDQTLKSIEVYDILGRILFTDVIDSNDYEHNTGISNQVILVKVRTDKGTITKKAYMK